MKHQRWSNNNNPAAILSLVVNVNASKQAFICCYSRSHLMCVCHGAQYLGLCALLSCEEHCGAASHRHSPPQISSCRGMGSDGAPAGSVHQPSGGRLHSGPPIAYPPCTRWASRPTPNQAGACGVKPRLLIGWSIPCLFYKKLSVSQNTTH